MADEVDKAQEREEAVRDAALQRVQQELQGLARARPADFHGLCTECEAPLPSPRIDAGYYRCVECVTRIEARNKIFRR